MSTDTLNRVSVYPMSAADLLPQARTIAAELGHIPSRNHLMKRFSIGAPKATELRDLLNAENIGTQSAPLTSTEPDRPQVEFVDEPAEPATPAQPQVPAEPEALPAVDGHPDTSITITPAPAATAARRKVATWPVFLIALPAFVAIWSGWVGLGGLTGFGVVHPLPGIWDEFSINTAITLPIGVEVYAWYALKAWLSGTHTPRVARRFAKWSAIGSLIIGSAGQVAYHLMESAGMTVAPWQITTAVSCLPVIVLGMGAALAHLLNSDEDHA